MARDIEIQARNNENPAIPAEQCQILPVGQSMAGRVWQSAVPERNDIWAQRWFRAGACDRRSLTHDHNGSKPAAGDRLPRREIHESQSEFLFLIYEPPGRQQLPERTGVRDEHIRHSRTQMGRRDRIHGAFELATAGLDPVGQLPPVCCIQLREPLPLKHAEFVQQIWHCCFRERAPIIAAPQPRASAAPLPVPVTGLLEEGDRYG